VVGGPGAGAEANRRGAAWTAGDGRGAADGRLDGVCLSWPASINGAPCNFLEGPFLAEFKLANSTIFGPRPF
jgi:hypothetical protein